MKKKHKQNNFGTQQIEAVISGVLNKQAKLLIGEIEYICPIPGTLTDKKDALTVGDRVLVQGSEEAYRITEKLSRQSVLVRGNRRVPGEEIVLAANVSCVVAVVTAEYLLNQSGFPETALIAAKRAGISYVLWIGKGDLVGEQANEQLKEKLRGYRIVADYAGMGSSLTPPEELRAFLQGKTTVVIGDRSCGKTALIRALLGEETGTVFPAGSTHTAALYGDGNGMQLIDTSGFRDFALQEVTEAERNAALPEFAALAEQCYYSNCTHTHEEDCAVLAALRQKQLRRERYEVFQRLAKAGAVSVPKEDYRRTACTESFSCKVCGALIVPEGAGTRHRNHCPCCLSSLHVDNEPGDRESLCKGIMEPVSVWVRKNGEWAIIHRCRDCGTLSSNRIAADDNPALLLSIAVKPLATTPFPLDRIESQYQQK